MFCWPPRSIDDLLSSLRAHRNSINRREHISNRESEIIQKRKNTRDGEKSFHRNLRASLSRWCLFFSFQCLKKGDHAEAEHFTFMSGFDCTYARRYRRALYKALSKQKSYSSVFLTQRQDTQIYVDAASIVAGGVGALVALTSVVVTGSIGEGGKKPEPNPGKFPSYLKNSFYPYLR